METPSSPSRIPERVVDTAGLKALAHPLRVAIVDELSTHGPATASKLADRLGESSGATSYHLRQLAKHDFVREVEGRGSARERWWERVPGGIAINTIDYDPGSAAFAAGQMVAREWERARTRLLEEFLVSGPDLLDKPWGLASRMMTTNLRLTVAELTELTDRLDAAIEPLIEEFRGRDAPGARPVQLHLNAFPVVSGVPTPDPDEGTS